MEIKISKKEEDALFFIVDQFILTHDNESRDIYKGELRLCKKLRTKLQKEFALQKHDE